MQTRQLLITDLPKKRRSANSLHIPVVFNGKERFICDIHFTNKELCYLENSKGNPTQINKLQLIENYNKENIIKKLELKEKQFAKLNKKQNDLLKEIVLLKENLKNEN